MSSLRHAGPDLMTFVAGNFLVLRVTKTDAKCRHEFRSSGITAQLMTSAARGNIATAGLRPRGVASITSCVGIKAGGYRHCHAAARRLMTSRAANIAHLQMSRVIELHPKALQAGERFQCSRFHVRVANSADRTLGIRKLLRVTSGTR